MKPEEKDIIDELAASAEGIEVPGSLTPEAVRSRLQLLEEEERNKQDAKNDRTSDDSENEISTSAKRQDAESKGKSARTRFHRLKFMPATMAACLAIICGIGIFALMPIVQSSQNASQPVDLTQDASSAPLPGETSQNSEETGVSPVPVATSYEQLRDIVKGAQSAIEDRKDRNKTAENENSSDYMDSFSISGLSSTDSKQSGDFSATNVRTIGIDEGDIVKTDGNTIFTLQDYGYKVFLVQADKGKMKKVSSIKIGDLIKSDGEICDMLVENDRLHLIVDVWGKKGNVSTHIVTYDVSNPENPKKIGTVKQEGYYHSARMVNGYLYIFTSFTPDLSAGSKAATGFVPEVSGKAIECNDVFLPTCASGADYMVMSSINTQEPNKIVQTKAMLAGADDVYMSNDSIYLYGVKRDSALYGSKDIVGPVAEIQEASSNSSSGTDDNDLAENDLAIDGTFSTSSATPIGSDDTVICKLSYHDGYFYPVGETSVAGMVDDTFSIDEYEGNTRVITTLFMNDGETSNNVYVLNKDLKLIGSINNLAPNEQIYSARLIGDIGYFVTYRQVDPLFSVDFSDPENPKVIGELKIPGFSDYLHPWGEGKMLGIGQATSKNGSVTDGLKLTMFDTSDPSNVKELHTYTLKGIYFSDALYDHRAVYADVERNLIGFPATSRQDKYYMFSYDEKHGFVEEMVDVFSNYESGAASRGIRIDDSFYVIGEEIINSYNMNRFKKIESLKL